MVFVFVEDVGGYMVSVLPREIDVKVGRTASMGVDKSFKIEIKFDGVYVGDAQAVGHHGVCA